MFSTISSCFQHFQLYIPSCQCTKKVVHIVLITLILVLIMTNINRPHFFSFKTSVQGMLKYVYFMQIFTNFGFYINLNFMQILII